MTTPATPATIAHRVTTPHDAMRNVMADMINSHTRNAKPGSIAEAARLHTARK